MKRSIRRTLSRYITLSSCLAALAASAGFWIFGEIYFRMHYAAAERDGMENVRARLELFDVILARAEADIVGPGRKALLSLGERFSSMEEVRRVGTAGLRVIAAELGVDEVYFIDAAGIVFASSLEEDVGLDLFSLGPRFSASLRTLYGQGRVGDQRLTQSTKKGALTVYQYYGPVGRDFLVEVSSRADDLLDRLYEEYGYAGLVRLAFRPELSGVAPGRTVRLVDLIGDSGSLWSLLEIGVSRESYADLVEIARAGGNARVERGGVVTAVLRVPLGGRSASVVHDRRFAIIEIDRRPLYSYRAFALLTLLISAAAALAVSAFAASRSYVRGFSRRVESLEAAIARAAEGSGPFEYRDPADDEISSIAAGVAALVGQVRRRADERESLAARLSAEIEERADRERELAAALSEQLSLRREVQHRVKNNMQIVLSLIGLQMGAESDERVVRSLDSTRTRMYAMSMVLDRLSSQKDMERLLLDDFLRDFAYYLDGAHRRPGFFATIRTNGAGLYLAADAAVPVGLIVGELVSNALLHAFPDRSAGVVEVSASADGSGFALTVRDDGIGGDAAAEGVGTLIVRALVSQLGASLSVELSGGRVARLSVPGGVLGRSAGVGRS